GPLLGRRRWVGFSPSSYTRSASLGIEIAEWVGGLRVSRWMSLLVPIRFEMCRHDDLLLRKPRRHAILHLVCPVVSLRDAQVFWKQQVVFDPELIVDAPMPHLVEIRDQLLPPGFSQHIHQGSRVPFVGLLHKTRYRLATRAKTRRHNVSGNQNGHGRVEPQYFRKVDEGNAGEHAQARPHIGKYVPPVRDQNQIVVLLARSD